MPTNRSGGPTPDPEHMGPDEARAVRYWIIGTTIAGAAVLSMPQHVDGAVERMVTILAIATFATGAVRMRRPRGFRIILATAALGGVAELLAMIFAPIAGQG